MTHSSVSSYEFESVEQLDEVTHAMGWLTEYRQLKPGRFQSAFTILESDSWFLMEEQSSRRIEVEAPAPTGMFVLALAVGKPGSVNGQTLTCDHIFLQNPDSEFRATLPAGMRAIQLGIPAEQFEDVVLAVAPELMASLEGTITIATSPGRLTSVRRAMRAVLFAHAARKATQDEAVSRILADFVAAAADHGNLSLTTSLHRVAARRALNRAREYIEARLDQKIRIASLCRYTGANLRSLERTFTREMGMTPQQYVKARRLNAVHRHLMTAEKEEGIGVTEVALNHGFAHLGRFAGDYHRHFGQYPRETLQSQ